MNDREQQILKLILEALDRLDGGQMTEPMLHAEINLRIRPNATVAEFEKALKNADMNKWITGVRARLSTTTVKWSLRDEGRAALAEM